MEWGRNQTIFTFYSVFALIVLVSIVNLMLSTINFTYHLNPVCEHKLLESFIYFIGTFYINVLGCLWFRLVRYKASCAHGFIHTLAFAWMLYGHWHVILLIYEDNIEEAYSQYVMSVLAIFCFLIQYLLSFHFMVFRIGKTPSEVAFRTVIHTFGGVLMLILCTFDAFLISFKLSHHAHFLNAIEEIFPWVPVTVLFISLGIWFLILNPYFDWRRMSILTRSRPSSTSGSPKTAPIGRRNRSKSPHCSTEEASSYPPSRTSSKNRRPEHFV